MMLRIESRIMTVIIDTMSTSVVTRELIFEILKALPANKLSSAYDYLRFLQQQAGADDWPLDATPDEMAQDDAEWDALFKTEQSQNFLNRMAADARAEYAAGQTEPLEELLIEENIEGDEVTN